MCGRTFWPSPEAGHNAFLWEVPALYPEERRILISEDKGHSRSLNKQAVLSVPRVTTLIPHTLCLIIPFFKPNVKMFTFNILQVFTSLGRLLCHIKLVLNKFVYFSLVNVFCYRGPNWELRKAREKIFCLPYNTQSYEERENGWNFKKKALQEAIQKGGGVLIITRSWDARRKRAREMIRKQTAHRTQGKTGYQ